MEAEVGKLCEALNEGNMSGIMQGHKGPEEPAGQILRRVGSCLGRGEGVLGSDGVLGWKAMELTREVLEMSGQYTERGADQD